MGHSKKITFSALALAVGLASAPAHAMKDELHLDFGGATLVQGAGRLPALAGTMGFRYGFDPHTEFRLGVDYGRFLAGDEPGQWELTGVGVAGYFAPYPGRLQPLLGLHMGMSRVEADWKPLVGLEAQALATLHRSVLGYASVMPGAWFGDDTEIWIKLGLGLRLRLGL